MLFDWMNDIVQIWSTKCLLSFIPVDEMTKIKSIGNFIREYILDRKIWLSQLANKINGMQIRKIGRIACSTLHTLSHLHKYIIYSSLFVPCNVWSCLHSSPSFLLVGKVKSRKIKWGENQSLRWLIKYIQFNS